MITRTLSTIEWNG